jgi:nucleotide-binding universal stress UspA family protein
MTTLNSILVAVDFSEASGAAVEHGLELAKVFNASLHLLHVVDEPLRKTWAGYTPCAELLETVDRLRTEARGRLEQLVARTKLQDGRIVVATAWGDPSDEVLKYARSHDIDLIVCGTHGRRGWDHLTMGSVAERVVRVSSCPVLTIRAAARRSGASTAA